MTRAFAYPLLALLLLPIAAHGQARIGLGAPISGPDAVFGTELRNGVEQAVADINAKGGVLGRKLSVVIGDDAGELKRGLAAANKFVDQKINLVVGHFNSSVTLAASEIYANHDILEITPASTNPQITERGLDLMFRTCGRDDQQSAVAAKFLAAQPGRRIAILYDNTAYGKALADDLRKRLLQAGLKDVLYDGVNKGEKDYSNIVGRIKAANADFLYWSGDGIDAGLIVKEMRAAGVPTRLIGSDSIASDEYVMSGGDAIEGTLMTFPPDPRLRPTAADVMKEFKARDINPEVYTLYAYAAVEVLRQAAQAAGSFDPAAMAKIMHSGRPFATVLGTISYDAKGDVTTPDYAIFVWKRGWEDQMEYGPLAAQ